MDQDQESTAIDLDQLCEEYDNYNGKCIYVDTSLDSNLPTLSPKPNKLKRIDFVLVYSSTPNQLENAIANHKPIRAIFEENLVKEGLMLEHVDNSVGNPISYVHIYANWDVLARYAEIMALRMPMKTIQSNLKLLFDEETNADSKAFTTVFTREKEYLFDIPEHDREDFFTPSQRAEIIDYILRRTKFDQNNDVFSIGINKLLADRVYDAAYPLHDVGVNCTEKNCKHKRCELLTNWALLKCMFRFQPLDDIVGYFGVKISMYYAWVGFYTMMLIPASIIGLISFLYGLLTVGRDTPTVDICGYNETIPVCPACATNCDYTEVSDGCLESKAAFIFGNSTTIFFAVFTSLWVTIFLELWKRYSAVISHKWDLSDFSTVDEYPRPEFLASLAKTKVKIRVNPINRREEPYISFLAGQLPYFLISSSFVILCIVLTLLIMVSIIVYRVSVQIAFYAYQKRNPDSEFIQQYGGMIALVTAAIINLILIMTLSMFYQKLAYMLTELEMHRTQVEFDNSLTLKMYLFQFVNYYSSFFYIAFFKGRFASTPPDGSLQAENRSYLIESCPFGGCYFDLTIQLVIIFFGKNFVNSIIEYILPFMTRFYNRRRYLAQNAEKMKLIELPQWEQDYLLESWNHMSLFYEYLELVIQFGFVTIFVSAFPLAPLLALVNNIFEIRLDAQKMLHTFKRPVAQRVKDIGIWYTILDVIGNLSVFTNSMIIAFNTDIIPRALYYFDHNYSLKGFVDSTYSTYKITNSDPPLNRSEYCLYQGYQEPPWSSKPYHATEQYWRVLVAKIIFVVVFQNIVAGLSSLLKGIIPDEPRKIRLQKRQHLYLTNELIVRHELKSRKMRKSSSRMSG